MGFALYWFGLDFSVIIMLYIFSQYSIEVVEASTSVNAPYRIVCLIFSRILILVYTVIVLYNRAVQTAA